MTEAPESSVQVPLPGSPQRATGDARVDTAVNSLGGLADAEIAEHAAIIEAAHDQLREVLAALDDNTPPGDDDA